MIAIDASALMAIVRGESDGQACRDAIDGSAEILIAAPTLVEALIVAAGRDLHGEMGA